jgi:hydrogenase expression/formation protein HypD
MKYIDEFRDGEVAQKLAVAIRREARADRRYHFMEFCGGHTHAISRYGVSDLLPDNVKDDPRPRLPGLRAADRPRRSGHPVGAGTGRDFVHLRRLPARAGLGWAVPAQGESPGRDIRMVYSSADAVVLAQKNPDKQVVFFAIGFETTTPPTAVAIKQAAVLGLSNFSVLCCHVLTPSAISSILESPEVRQWGTVPLDGFIGPAHVSTIIGSRPYEFFAEEYRKPVVIAGFEPLDVMLAIRMLIRQVNEGRAEVENEFSRAVDRNGNLKAQQLVGEVFEMRKHFEWRGLNVLPYSALRIRSQFAEFDAEKRFNLNYQPVPDHKACECGAILRGVKRPQDCKLFGTVCTPENPIGSCMVSSEGACAAHYTYGRYKDVA